MEVDACKIVSVMSGHGLMLVGVGLIHGRV